MSCNQSAASNKSAVNEIRAAFKLSAIVAHLSPVSSNVKTGPIPVTTSAASTCPVDCPFATANEGGCYAASGPVYFHWLAVSSGKRGDNWVDHCYSVATLKTSGLWRANQAGDLPGDGISVDRVAVQMLVDANNGVHLKKKVGKAKKGFTYTHYDVLENANNRAAVASANKQGFTVNLSANTLEHADRLAALNIAPVAVVLPSSLARKEKRNEVDKRKVDGFAETLPEYKARLQGLATPAGRRVVVCPATYQDNVDCATCGLCQRAERPIIGFPAHGSGSKKVDRVIAIRSVK